MRDVTPRSVDLKALLTYLVEFIKHPVKNISPLPDWNWSSLISVHIMLAVISGVLAGLLKFNFYRIANGLFLMPFVSTAIVALFSMYLYYYFQFFENRTESFLQVCKLVVLSAIPFYLFQVIAEYFAPISIVGISFASLLAAVGLSENFKVEKKRALQVVGIMYALTLLAWIMGRFT